MRWWAWAALTGAGCAGGPDRDSLVREAVLRADAPWWGRSEELAEKYAVMAADPYDFYRGTAGLFWADAARRGAERAETGFLDDPGASAVLLFGDAHPENLGTVRPADGPVGVAVVDLDGAAFGPWTLDLRRAALGVALLADDLGAVEDATRSFVAGYLDGLAGGDSVGVALERLIDEATLEGDDRRRLREWTSQGAFRFGDPVATEDRLAPLSQAEAELVDALEPSLQGPEGLRVLDRARRRGAGISSRPAYRFILLVDQGGEGDADDELVQVREVIDPPVVPGLSVGGLFEGPGERPVEAARRLWAAPDANPWAQAVQARGMSFKVLSASSYFQGPDHSNLAEELVEGDLGYVDLLVFCADLGRVIGGGHARGGTVDGRDSGEQIAADLDGRSELLAEELLAAAEADLERLREDHAWFVDAVAADPLLGLGSIRGDVR